MANTAHSHAKRSGRAPSTAKSASARPGASRTPGAKPVTQGAATNSGKAAPRPTTISTKTSVANGTNGAKAAAQSSRLAAIRERAGQGAPQRRVQVRRGQRKAWYQGAGAIWATVGLVAAAILVFLIVAHSSGAGDAYYTPVSSTVFNEVTGVNPTVLNKVSSGGISQPLDAAPANTALLKDASGKPLVLYIGAEYCPYCAAERWSLIVALSRFGTFSHLHNMVSSDNEGDSSINSLPTFTFRGATYTSPYLAFQSVELQDRYRGNLETMSDAQSRVFNLYDFPPYVASSSSGGGIPFASIGNQYFVHSAGYLPQVISSSTREEIAGNLSNPNNVVTQAIEGNANFLTAAFCKITNNQPASVCTADLSPTVKNVIPALQAQLPAPTK
jgi:hypothetical protein